MSAKVLKYSRGRERCPTDWLVVLMVALAVVGGTGSQTRRSLQASSADSGNTRQLLLYVCRPLGKRDASFYTKSIIYSINLAMDPNLRVEITNLDQFDCSWVGDAFIIKSLSQCGWQFRWSFKRHIDRRARHARHMIFFMCNY